jgi:hypothetical protein
MPFSALNFDKDIINQDIRTGWLFDFAKRDNKNWKKLEDAKEILEGLKDET